MPDDQTVLQAALHAAALGYRVHPLRVGDKRPALTEWQHRATSDPEQVATWFGEQYARGGLGIATGSGLLVLDVDPPHGGVESLQRLSAEHAALPKGYRVRTPSGGFHHYLKVPADLAVRNSAGRLAQGLDVRAAGGYVVAPPTPLAAGGAYSARHLLPPLEDLPEAPRWLLDLLQRQPSVAVVEPDAAWSDLSDRERDQATRHRTRRTGEVTRTLDDLTAGATRDPAEYRGAPWDSTTHAAACTLVRLARVPSQDGTEVELQRARLMLTEHAPKDDGFTPADHERVWRSAVRAVTERGEVSDWRNEPLTLPGPPAAAERAPSGRSAAACLDEYRATARRWLGPTYDLEAGLAVLAAAAVDRLDGDPVWLMTVSGSGNAKTETLSALTGGGATVVSTIASEGALLSGTASKDRGRAATGGLLRQVGASGVVAVKDVTSILSMNKDARAAVLAALREVYDGTWVRTLGVDGGRTLEWRGRLVVIGAVTSAWDKAHAVIASMGDRFVLVRPSSRDGRRESGRQALDNTGAEVTMRAELAAAVGAVLAAVDAAAVPDLDEAEVEHLLAAADLVTLGRTAVDIDYRGAPVSADEPEMPTRFAKQLQQVFRGGMAIGMDRAAAFDLAMRCARDSMPPARLELLQDVAAHPRTTTSEAQRRVQKPRSSVDRVLQSLHLLGLLHQDPSSTFQNGWTYSLAPGIDPRVLTITRNVVSTGYGDKRESDDEDREHRGSNLSGDPSPRHCRVCHPATTANGLCTKQDLDHEAARLFLTTAPDPEGLSL